MIDFECRVYLLILTYFEYQPQFFQNLNQKFDFEKVLIINQEFLQNKIQLHESFHLTCIRELCNLKEIHMV